MRRGGGEEGGGLCATPTVEPHMVSQYPICSERILVRLLRRPGARKQADEDLTEGESSIPRLSVLTAPA